MSEQLVSDPLMSDDALAKLQRDTFGYFLHETNPDNGLVPDNTREDSPCSIVAVGMALACYPIGVERGYIAREEAINRVLTTLRFFWNSPHGPEPDATGYHGFFYHFLDMKSGARAMESELSTIDSTILLAGALVCAAYFNEDTPPQNEIRELATALYHRADWQWAQNGEATVTMGWKPECGFLTSRWQGYNEGLILYLLGLGSPTHPLPDESYAAWTKTYQWETLFDQEYLHAGPLFIHQMSHLFVDFRGIQDEFMREKCLDYFENSRRATYLQQQYAMRNPNGFKGYGENCWGITASDGPGPMSQRIDGQGREFFDYCARGIPYGPDDGTLAPWGAVTSLPFAPEIVLPALEHFNTAFPHMTSKYGFKCSFNPTYDSDQSENGWISKGYYGLDQGPVVMMIENYRSVFLWRLMRHCAPIVTGLQRAGFSGGWLDGRKQTAKGLTN